MCLVRAEARFSGTGFTERCEPPYGYWESNQSHLEEQLFSQLLRHFSISFIPIFLFEKKILILTTCDHLPSTDFNLTKMVIDQNINILFCIDLPNLIDL